MKLSDLPVLVRNRMFLDGLTLREATKQTGVSASTLSRLLNGVKTMPDTATLLALANWLGCDITLTRRSP